MVELNNTNVYINGYEFLAVSVVSLEMSVRPLSHPAEEIFTITDHVRQMPDKIKLVLKLFDRWEDSNTLVESREEKLALIQEWYKNRDLNTLSTDLKDYTSMLITKVKIAEVDSSHNSFGVEIDLQEVLMAFLQHVEGQWYTDVDGNIYEQTAYESAYVDGVLSKSKPEAPYKESTDWYIGKYYDEMQGWLGDFFNIDPNMRDHYREGYQ